MIEKYVKNLSANVYLNAAVDMGLNMEVISADYSLARIYGNAGALTVCKAFIGHDNAAMMGVIQDKQLTHRLLESANIPVPSYKAFKIRPGKLAEADSTPVFEFASRHYPVVVKPPAGNLGRGVYVGICDDDQLAYSLSCLLASDSYPSRGGGKHLIVEKQLLGREYRILICAGVVIDILEKFTGQVTGNGRDSIEKLIENENRRRGDAEIAISDRYRIRAHLALSGLSFDRVPGKGDRVTLDNTCYFPTGGVMQRVDQSGVDPSQIDLFHAAARRVGLHLIGIDYICENILLPWRDTRNGVLEVNAGTSAAIHYLARPGPDLTPVQRIITFCLETVDFFERV